MGHPRVRVRGSQKCFRGRGFSSNSSFFSGDSDNYCGACQHEWCVILLYLSETTYVSSRKLSKAQSNELFPSKFKMPSLQNAIKSFRQPEIQDSNHSISNEPPKDPQSQNPMDLICKTSMEKSIHFVNPLDFLIVYPGL